MRILGLDIGTKSIKAVEVDSAFGRYEIRDYHETPIQAGEDPGQALSRLINSLPKRVDRAVTALRTGSVTFRNLQLPAKNKKALQAAIGFELEDELPFPIEQCVFDYSVTAQARIASQVHVATTLQKNVAAHLHACQIADVDPDIVTSEAWAYRTLLNRMTPQTPDQLPILVVQLGHEKTTLYCHHQGQPVMARDIPWGGRDLTVAISKKYDMPIDQAERTKLDNGFIIPPGQTRTATLEQLEFSDTLLRATEPLLREFRAALLACKNLTRSKIGIIYFAGGTSLLPGLAPFVQEQLATEVKPLAALSAVSPSGVAYSEQTDAAFALAASLALCMVGPERSTCINFRRGEFSKRTRAREFDTQTVRRLLLATAAVSASLFASLIVESVTYKSKLAEVNTQLERSVKLFFPGLGSSALRTYMASTTTLKTTINKELEKQRDLFKLLGPNPHSPVDYLKELSSVIPKSTVVDMIHFQAGAAPSSPFSPTADTSATLSFVVASPQIVDQMAELFSSKQAGLKKEKVEEIAAAAGEGKRWKVTFSGSLGDPSYGK